MSVLHCERTHWQRYQSADLELILPALLVALAVVVVAVSER